MVGWHAVGRKEHRVAQALHFAPIRLLRSFGLPLEGQEVLHPARYLAFTGYALGYDGLR